MEAALLKTLLRIWVDNLEGSKSQIEPCLSADAPRYKQQKYVGPALNSV